jgi:hypothetical protein
VLGGMKIVAGGESEAGRTVVEAEMVEQYTAWRWKQEQQRLRGYCGALVATTVRTDIDIENYQTETGPPFTSRHPKVVIESGQKVIGGGLTLKPTTRLSLGVLKPELKWHYNGAKDNKRLQGWPRMLF